MTHDQGTSTKVKKSEIRADPSVNQSQGPISALHGRQVHQLLDNPHYDHETRSAQYPSLGSSFINNTRKVPQAQASILSRHAGSYRRGGANA